MGTDPACRGPGISQPHGSISYCPVVLLCARDARTAVRTPRMDADPACRGPGISQPHGSISHCPVVLLCVPRSHLPTFPLSHRPTVSMSQCVTVHHQPTFVFPSRGRPVIPLFHHSQSLYHASRTYITRSPCLPSAHIKRQELNSFSTLYSVTRVNIRLWV